MKRYLAMVAVVTLLALPVLASAEVNDEIFQPQQKKAADVFESTEELQVEEVAMPEQPTKSADSSPEASWVKPYAGNETSYTGE